MEVDAEGNASAASVAKDETHAMLRSLTAEERERVSLLQQLIATANQPRYGQRQRAVAKKLGMTERNVRRLLRHLREEGIESVVRRERSDRGATRISEDWQKFMGLPELPWFPLDIEFRHFQERNEFKLN